MIETLQMTKVIEVHPSFNGFWSEQEEGDGGFKLTSKPDVKIFKKKDALGEFWTKTIWISLLSTKGCSYSKEMHRYGIVSWRVQLTRFWKREALVGIWKIKYLTNEDVWKNNE